MLHAFADLNETADIPWYPLPRLLEWEKDRTTVWITGKSASLFSPAGSSPPASYCARSQSALIRRVDDLLPLVRVCAMASQLSAFICEPGAHLPEVFDTLELRFALPKPLIHEVVGRSLQRVDELAQTFEVEVDSKRDTEALMEKARVVLAQLSGKLAEQHPPSDTGLPSPAASTEPRREYRCGQAHAGSR